MAGFKEEIKSIFGAVVTNRIENDKIFDNICYGISKRFTIAASGSLDLLIDPTAFTGNTLVILPVNVKGIGSRVNIDLYVGTDADDDGTILNAINRNNNSSTVSELIARINPTINDSGTVRAEFLIPADGAGASANVGGEVTEGLPFVMNKDFKYMLRITNTSTSSIFYGSFSFNFYEV